MSISLHTMNCPLTTTPYLDSLLYVCLIALHLISSIIQDNHMSISLLAMNCPLTTHTISLVYHLTAHIDRITRFRAFSNIVYIFFGNVESWNESNNVIGRTTKN